MDEIEFEWDELKNDINQEKHGISFYEAQYAFFDKNRIIAEDLSHSSNEERFFCFCFGLNKDKTGVFEGGGYVEKGVYRPALDCSMKSIKYNYFCELCTQAIIQMVEFYAK